MSTQHHAHVASLSVARRLAAGMFFLQRFINHSYTSIKQRPAGWALVNLGMAHRQLTQHGHVTNSMVLVNAFQLYYIVDALW
jgi:hypothetical protein